MKRDEAMRAARPVVGRSCVILVACSGTKEPAGAAWASPSGNGILDELDLEDRTAVLTVRRRLSRTANAVPGPDVGGAATAGRYLPACQRYRGSVYRYADSGHWPRVGERCVVIVSALYGLVFPWEPIQDYDVTMTSTFEHRRRVLSVWRQASLGAVLARWAASRGIECVIDLLSQNYRRALDDLAALDQVGIRRIAFDYAGRFQAANLDRGRDLAQLLALA